jgi:hypothetical protein
MEVIRIDELNEFKLKLLVLDGIMIHSYRTYESNVGYHGMALTI